MEQTNPNTNRPNRMGKISKIVLCIAVGLLVFRSGYYFGQEGFVFEPKTFEIINQKDKPGTVDYDLLWQAIDALNENYIEKPINPQKILYGAIQGVARSTGDPYTEFFSPEDLELFRTDLKGSFDGIGAEVGKRGGNIVVVAPLDDSPAKKAGLIAGDFILKVNDQSTEGWSVDQAVKEIRGNKGTKVKLSIFREGRTEAFDVEIERAEIVIKSVKVDYKEVNGKQIAVLTITRFAEDTRDAVARAVRDIGSKNVSGLILDLRNNPGGYLDTSVEVASHWIQKDALVVTEERSKEDSIPFKSLGYRSLEKTRTVVLINQGSASASEIVAGALKDHKIATLIGEKSFGKGSVQDLIELPGNSALKVTIAKWVTPGGKNLNKDGLVPDIEVKLTEDDYKNNRDPQMDKALEEITK